MIIHSIQIYTSKLNTDEQYNPNQKKKKRTDKDQTSKQLQVVESVYQNLILLHPTNTAQTSQHKITFHTIVTFLTFANSLQIDTMNYNKTMRNETKNSTNLDTMKYS